MRALLIVVVMATFAALVSSSPINSKRQLINRPTNVIQKRSVNQYIKTMPHEKGHHSTTPFPELRKGEYKCGNRVCKLEPGEIPRGCHGVCQYRV